MKNVSITNCSFTNAPAVRFDKIDNVSISNLVLDNIVSTDSFSNNVIGFEHNPGTSISIDGFSLKNSIISGAEGIIFGSSSNGAFFAENFIFSNNQLSNSVSAIKLGEYREANFSEVLFQDIHFEKEDNNLLLNLNNIESTVDSSISFRNITIINSTVPLLKISNSDQSKTINQYITFNGITYKD